MIEVTNLVKNYNDVKAVQSINFKIDHSSLDISL